MVHSSLTDGQLELRNILLPRWQLQQSPILCKIKYLLIQNKYKMTKVYYGSLQHLLEKKNVKDWFIKRSKVWWGGGGGNICSFKWNSKYQIKLRLVVSNIIYNLINISFLRMQRKIRFDVVKKRFTIQKLIIIRFWTF